MRNKFSFGQAPSVSLPRSRFDLSYRHKTTFNGGYLIPFYTQEIYPGDTIQCHSSGFVRLATPLFPFMDDAYMDTQFFFVPNRLVWSNWQRFMGEQDNPTDTIDYQTPVIDPGAGGYNVPENSIFQYLGLPIGVDLHKIKPLAFVLRGINLIWNKWYRDQNLQDSVPMNVDDGPDDPTDYTLLRRAKFHDYFSSCLPWPQKGDAVPLPVGGTAPVVFPTGKQLTGNLPVTGIGVGTNAFSHAGAVVYETTGPTTFAHAAMDSDNGGADTNFFINGSAAVAGVPQIFADATVGSVNLPAVTDAFANLSAATAIPLNSFRYAIALQTLLERDARGGTRYIEINKQHFGVTSDDARLQRPEYLGGGTSNIMVHPVARTTSLVANTTWGNVGDLGAFATGAFHGHGYTKSFLEHGWVIGFVSVRANLSYQQNLNKMWSRRDKYDYYWPALAQIGEQPVLKKELYCDGSATDDEIFGYQEPFADLRFRPSMSTGQFSSYNAAPLDAWTLTLDFGTTHPQLNDVFIPDQPPFARVVAVETQPQFIGDFMHRNIAARVMPTYGVPASLSRF